MAVYMSGKDKDLDGVSGNDVRFDGFYGEASYFCNRTYGFTVGFDYTSSDDDDSLELAGGEDEETISLLVHLYF